MEMIDISQSVKALDFGKQYGIRVQGVFWENEIFSIRDLCRQIRRDLVRTRYLGEKSVAMIEAVLKKHGLRLGMTDKELNEYAGVEHREKEMPFDTSVQEDAEAVLWEQRRYEIAKEMFVKYRILAIAAVNEADELIRALRR